jgi:hypothetical protein
MGDRCCFQELTFKVRITQDNQPVKFTVPAKPGYVAVDPFRRLFSRDQSDKRAFSRHKFGHVPLNPIANNPNSIRVRPQSFL